jgi:hypothetical protein
MSKQIRLDVMLRVDVAYRRACPDVRVGDLVLVHSVWVTDRSVQEVMVIAEAAERQCAALGRTFVRALSEHELGKSVRTA